MTSNGVRLSDWCSDVASSVRCATASPAAALLFGVAGMLSLIRWFGRSTAYAHHAPVRAARSDLAYAGTILAGLLIAMRTGADMPAIGGMLVAASLVGLLPFGLAYLRRPLAMAPARSNEHPSELQSLMRI